MSILGYLATTSSIFSVGLGIVLWAMRLRLNRLNAELNASNTARELIERALTANSENFTDYRARSEAKEEFLVSGLHHFRREELDGIEKEPDRDVRIRRRRSWVGGMLRISSPPSIDNGSRGVREDTST